MYPQHEFGRGCAWGPETRALPLLVEGNMQSPDDIEKAQAITFNTVHVPAFEPASTAPSSLDTKENSLAKELGAVLAGSKADT